MPRKALASREAYLARDLHRPHVSACSGRLELALGNLEAAADYLRELPGRLLAGGLNDPAHPSGPTRSRRSSRSASSSWPAPTWSRTRRTHERLGSPWATLGAARCRGLSLPPTGTRRRNSRPSNGLARAGRNAVSARAGPHPALPRRGAQAGAAEEGAREALEQALAIFEELGAPPLGREGARELRRISGRRPPSEELTETERRVADLAAQGRTNKEIAAELYMGVSTVETHLSRVYRKLGVRRARSSRGGWPAQGRVRQASGRGRPTLGLSAFRGYGPTPYLRRHGLRRRAIPPRPRLCRQLRDPSAAGAHGRRSAERGRPRCATSARRSSPRTRPASASSMGRPRRLSPT